jgi:hypothetical protein
VLPDAPQGLELRGAGERQDREGGAAPTCSSTSISMSAWESTRTPSLSKSGSCSILALRSSSLSPILSLSAIVVLSIRLLGHFRRNHTMAVFVNGPCFAHFPGHYLLGPLLAAFGAPIQHPLLIPKPFRKVISANVVSWCFPKFAQEVRRYGHLADAPSYANTLS